VRTVAVIGGISREEQGFRLRQGCEVRLLSLASVSSGFEALVVMATSVLRLFIRTAVVIATELHFL